MRFAIFQIGHPHIDRHGQGLVRGGQRIAVIHFAIGGVIAIEGRAIPGGDAGFVIVRLLARIIPDIVDLIGLADLVDPGIGRDRDGVVGGGGGGGGGRRWYRRPPTGSGRRQKRIGRHAACESGPGLPRDGSGVAAWLNAVACKVDGR